MLSVVSVSGSGYQNYFFQTTKNPKTNQSKNDSSSLVSLRTRAFGSNRHAMIFEETLFNILHAHGN